MCDRWLSNYYGDYSENNKVGIVLKTMASRLSGYYLYTQITVTSQSPYETAKKLHINLSIVYTRVIHFAVLKFGQGKSNLIAFIGRFFGHRGFYIYKETVAVQSIPCKKNKREGGRCAGTDSERI